VLSAFPFRRLATVKVDFAAILINLFVRTRYPLPGDLGQSFAKEVNTGKTGTLECRKQQKHGETELKTITIADTNEYFSRSYIPKQSVIL